MSAPPRLSESDIRAEVERIYLRKHRSQLVALFGAESPAGSTSTARRGR